MELPLEPGVTAQLPAASTPLMVQPGRPFMLTMKGAAEALALGLAACVARGGAQQGPGWEPES